MKVIKGKRRRRCPRLMRLYRKLSISLEALGECPHYLGTAEEDIAHAVLLEDLRQLSEEAEEYLIGGINIGSALGCAFEDRAETVLEEVEHLRGAWSLRRKQVLPSFPGSLLGR